MSRRTVVVTLVLAMSLSVLALAAGRSSSQEKTDYLIRVTSGVAGRDVGFDAAVLFRRPDATVQTMTLKTPFEMRSSGFGASAMFSVQGDATIMVEMVGHQGGKQVSRSTATGRAVVVGDNLSQGSSGFITSF
jgi:hypothetical protein